MFDLFSWSHIIILLTAALIIVGPKDLPRLMHTAGKWAGKARGMANEFRKSFDEMARQAELDELRKEIEDLKKNNPVADMADELNRATADVNLESGPSLATPESAPLPEASPEPRSGELNVTEAPRSGEFAVAEAKAVEPAAAEPPPP